MVVKNY